MGQLTDNMHGSIEGAQAAMAMITHGELAAACLTSLRLHVSCEAAQAQVGGPVVWHNRASLTELSLTTIIPTIVTILH
jgi:hypothetical protein